MRLKITLYFIWYCLKIRTNPWAFFQIHAHFFDVKKGIFSKYDIEQSIPNKWRLKSYKLKGDETIEDIGKRQNFPLFGKPEWGQNAHGISYIENNIELSHFLQHAKNSEVGYLLQDASGYAQEFEICFSKNPVNTNHIDIHSIVESQNHDTVHISSIHGETRYKEIGHDFSHTELHAIAKYIQEMCDLSMGRIGLKADTPADIVSGKFEVFEINIFIPLPLKLLAYNVDDSQKSVFLHKWCTTLAELTKHRPKQPYTEVFLRKIFLHYKIKIIHHKAYINMKKTIYKFIEKHFLGGCSDYNSLQVRRASRSKQQAREMFAKNDIPYAKGMIFFSPYMAYKFAKKTGFPLVLKPNVGGFSRGSHFPIMNWKEFWIAMFFVKWWWPTSVVEQYLLGKNYRVVATKGSVDIAMARTPGYVVGDGKKDISTLIDEENKIRAHMQLTPIIHSIEKSNTTKRYLKKQGYNLYSIPHKGEQVFMYHRVSLAPGGVLETIDVDTITPKNKALFIKIIDLFEANIFGIDVIMEKGIDVDYDKQKTIFLEVNSRPYLKMHNFPRIGKAPDMKPLYNKLDALDVEDRGIF